MSKINENNRAAISSLVEKLNKGNADEARSVYESVSFVLAEMVASDDERPDRTGRAITEAILANDLNAFCMAVCGWEIKSLFTKSGAITEQEWSASIAKQSAKTPINHAKAAVESCKKIEEGINELCSIMDIADDTFGELNRISTYKSTYANASAWKEKYLKFIIENENKEVN